MRPTEVDRSRRWQAVGLCALALSCVTATAGALVSSPPGVPAGALAGREFVALALTEDGWPRRLVPDSVVTVSFAWDGQSFEADTGCGLTRQYFRLRDGRLRIERPPWASVAEPSCTDGRGAQGRLLRQFFGADLRVRLNGPALTLSVSRFRLVLHEYTTD